MMFLIMCNFFKTFRYICLKTYDFNPTQFYSTPRLAWIAAVKKAKN